MMQRVLFLFAAMLCVANALVQSGLAMKNSKIAAPAARAVAPNMVVEESADAVVAAASTVGMMVAASASDFGGYTIPIIGLGLIGATIALLAGPVED
mmetsp:Transcript_11474/g.14435  ORF Transcript_11474/g.14435 Transcript_11474/m.14435 type:complete len:97 (-) Transcript_11474:253-543(-)